MFGSEILDVAAGLAFLFAALSLFATGAREVIEGWLQTRAIHLERGIRALLADPKGTGATTAFYNHPVIASLYTGQYAAAGQQDAAPSLLTGRCFDGKDSTQRLKFGSSLPAYIPARNFATALLDIAGRPSVAEGEPERPLTVAAIREGFEDRITEPGLRRAVSLALDTAGDDIERARTNLEKWFDSAMDRVSGRYRKETQWILFAIGLFTAVALNVDAIKVTQALYTNEGLRTAVLAEAEAVSAAEQAKPGTGEATLGCKPAKDLAEPASCTQQRLTKLGLPIGWDMEGVSLSLCVPLVSDNCHILIDPRGMSWSSLPGWLLTALAISLGAPFWFDLLNKIMVIRSTVKPHEKSPEEASEDRQSAAPPAPAIVVRETAPAAGPAGEPPTPSAVHTTPNRIEADDFPDARARLGGKLDPMEDPS